MKSNSVMFPASLMNDVSDYNKLKSSFKIAPSTIQSAYNIVLDNKFNNLLSTTSIYCSTLNVNIMNLKNTN